MSQPYVGEIRMFAGNFAPVGWAFCDGSLLAISNYETLFNLIGTTYGGDGQSTFALPDLRSRIPLHQGNGFTIAQTGGVEQVTLTTSQLPVHPHTASASTNNQGASSPTNGFWAASPTYTEYAATNDGTVMAPTAFGGAGNSQPHDNMVPFGVINFILSLFGVFPSPT
ncbi:MAG TPA: tail fiber protein [Candidatus Angelobacter sp.]|jgi:microcystin-dependent protein|nr:tail fiber protein [Candidatus Angelobacter sp.]